MYVTLASAAAAITVMCEDGSVIAEVTRWDCGHQADVREGGDEGVAARVGGLQFERHVVCWSV